jgi:hypothetical protein
VILVRLVAEAVAIGVHPDPDVFGDMLAREWIALRRRNGR